WTNYDLILSASMLEYLPKQSLARVLAGLHARMAPGGRILVMVTRKAPETKVLIEWWGHAERYTKSELIQAFMEAGLPDPDFLRFPLRYTWLNRADYVVQARSGIRGYPDETEPLSAEGKSQSC